MPASQDTQIHLSCRHFRCDSFRFDAQGRRLVLPFSSTRQKASRIFSLFSVFSFSESFYCFGKAS